MFKCESGQLTKFQESRQYDYQQACQTSKCCERKTLKVYIMANFVIVVCHIMVVGGKKFEKDVKKMLCNLCTQILTQV